MALFPVSNSINKANKTDLTSIAQTGSTASQAISSGTYFYLDGALVRAKANIASGASFTQNTNYEVVTAGGLNELNTAINTLKNAITDSGWKTVGTYMNCRKVGSIATVNIISNGYTISTTGWTTLGTLPTGFAPKDVSTINSIYTDATNWVVVNIGTDRTVKVIGTTQITGQTVYFTA